MSRAELFQKLKVKRKEIADREGNELFMVFTNKTLEETVKAMPATLDDLKLVKGWGKAKIAKYGREILDIISETSGVGLLTFDVRSPTPDIGEAIFSVSEFLEAVRVTLARLGAMRIQGEVSELRHRGSVVYFTLKDMREEAIVKCVLWAWKYEREYNYLEDGMEIIVDAQPEIYAKFGTFDVRVEKVEPVGEGALRKAFEALKKKLEAKGYFAEARKRPLPRLIQRIGVITSEKGEAINDFLKNVGSFGFEIVLADVRVEGDQAKDSIVSAFQKLNTARRDLDVLCLIRGGGGLENFKAFNTEQVAEAIISSRIPVLTGIGHERDITIASLSSDADFSTPTKVADAIRRGREYLLRNIEQQFDEMSGKVGDVLRETMRTYATIREDLEQAPDIVLERVRTRIFTGAQRLQVALGALFAAFRALEKTFAQAASLFGARMQSAEHTLRGALQHMRDAAARMFQVREQRIAIVEARLIPLNPEAPLQRGYSIAYGAKGKVLKQTNDVTIGEHITIQLYKGSIKSVVDEKNNGIV